MYCQKILFLFLILFLHFFRNYIYAQKDSAGNKIEPLPIISYDTDAGFGYGAKVFFLNQLNTKESFDLTLFNSTKGERWYRLVFSLPDFELRQGTRYPFALDISIDYDRWIHYSYFGVGNNSLKSNTEYYTRQEFEVNLIPAFGLNPYTVIQSGLKYKSVHNSNLVNITKLKLLNSTSTGTAESIILNASYRYDTRNSFVNPSSGFVFQLQEDWSFAGNARYLNSGIALQHYLELLNQTILTSRIALQSNIGKDVPVQFLNSIGGNQNLRGFPQDRFLDNVAGLFNLELRYPIIGRFGGIAAIDGGRVWSSFYKLSLSDWAYCYTAGLRFYMDTFLVRLDVGLSKEGTGIYFNFGQIF